MMKKMILCVMLLRCLPVDGMFLVPHSLDNCTGYVLRQVSDTEEEECLSAYEKGLDIPNNVDDLKFAIIGHDKEYEKLIHKGIKDSINGHEVDFKVIYDRAVVRDIFSLLGYRYERLQQYDAAFFWLMVATVGNSNYLQDALRVKREYNSAHK